MKHIGLSNELSNIKGKKNAFIDLAQLSRFGSCPSNLIIMVCVLLFPQHQIESIYRASSCILSKTSRHHTHPGALNPHLINTEH